MYLAIRSVTNVRLLFDQHTFLCNVLMCNTLSKKYIQEVMHICLLQQCIYVTNTLKLPKCAICWERSPKFIRKRSPPFTLCGGLSQTLPQSHSQHKAQLGKTQTFLFLVQCRDIHKIQQIVLEMDAQCLRHAQKSVLF